METTLREALRMLLDGEAKGIVVENSGGDICFYNDDLENTVRVKLPKPLTETRDVKRWECSVCGKIYTVNPRNDLCSCHTAEDNSSKWKWIVLTGTYTVEIPRKVKRRVEVGAADNKLCDMAWFATKSLYNMPDNAAIYAEWEE